MAASYNLKEAYAHMLDRHPNMKHITYDVFKEVISQFYKKLKTHVVVGESVKLPNTFGSISSVTLQRSFQKKRINYPASMKLRKELVAQGKTPRKAGETEGEDWIVYYTDSEYNRITWDRTSSHKISKNSIAYALRPAWHFRREFSFALQNDELNMLLK